MYVDRKRDGERRMGQRSQNSLSSTEVGWLVYVWSWLEEDPECGVPTSEQVGPVSSTVDVRLQQLEEFGDDYRQDLSMAAPAVEDQGPPGVSRDLAQLANESQAQLVETYPARFCGYVT